MTRLPLLLALILLGAPGPSALAKSGNAAIQAVQRSTESQVRALLEPVLNKYCADECKLMAVDVTVDISVPEELAPGFDEIDPKSAADLEPVSARVKLLMDEKIGPISRSRLVELLHRHLEAFEYPVKVETQLAHFPQPIGSAAKIAELRDKVTKQYRTTIEDLFRQFCPDHCLLADYELKTEPVNPEEAQYGSTGEFLEDGGVAIRVKDVASTILIDDALTPEEQNNILEMAKLKTAYLKNVSLTAKAMHFPRALSEVAAAGGVNGLRTRGLASDKKSTESSENKRTDRSESTSESKSQSNTSTNNTNSSNSTNSNNTSENNNRQERFERVEKIERVESGDAVQAELQKFKVYGLVFVCAIISLLIFIAMTGFRSRSAGTNTVQRVIQSLAGEQPTSMMASPGGERSSEGNETSERNAQLGKRVEITRLHDELMALFAQQPKVAKQVFTRVLTEDGVEVTAQYIHLFGETIVLDMLRDPSLQSDINELMEYYAKNPIELKDEEKLELLRRLHSRSVAGKLVVMGSRSSHQFDFLADMDGLQILELIRNESLTVKAIVLTQCDNQKRAAMYAQLDEETRMRLLSELSRIDYLPRDYISNVATALKRKRHENPRLNTEHLPGSDVLVNLLERSSGEMQKAVVSNLERNNPESARTIKNKLVCLDTLRFLRDGQLLEVVLSLKHDELLQFLKGAPSEIREAIISRSPKDLAADLDEELAQIGTVNRDTYGVLERKILNRMKLMANEGLINLSETNERMFAAAGGTGYTVPQGGQAPTANIRKASGW